MKKNLLFKFVLMGFFFSIAQPVKSQSDSARVQPPQVYISGFIDVFYAYDFDQPEIHYRQPFLYNHNRHNEFNLNLGLIKVQAEHAKYRANLALQTGTYATDNYAAEPELLKHIFEANAGISLNKKNDLWFDAGIFASHIGFESAISLDNWTLTRSLLAENSPYYLSGAKLTYTPTEKLEMAALICNGWQRIQKVPGNSLNSFGSQVTFTPSANIKLNWSTFLGTDDPDTTRRMRYFNNLYGQFQVSEKLGLIAGFDIGAQQKQKNSSAYHYWFSPVLIARYQISENWAVGARAEYYQDKAAVIVSTDVPGEFKVNGSSVNLDYTPVANIAFRIEARQLRSQDKIFKELDAVSDKNLFIIASLAVKFYQ